MADIKWSIDDQNSDKKQKLDLICDWLTNLDNKSVLIKNRFKEGNSLDFAPKPPDEEAKIANVAIKGITFYYTEAEDQLNKNITFSSIEVDVSESSVIFAHKNVENLYVKMECLEPFPFQLPDAVPSREFIFLPDVKWLSELNDPDNAYNYNVITNWLENLNGKSVIIRNRIKEEGTYLNFETATDQDRLTILQDVDFRGLTLYFNEPERNFETQVTAGSVEIDTQASVVLFQGQDDPNLFIRIESQEPFPYEKPVAEISPEEIDNSGSDEELTATLETEAKADTEAEKKPEA